MKKIFGLALAAALLVFAACDDGSGGTSGGGTTLVIQNQSSQIIFDMLWNNVEFADRSSEFYGTWAGRYSQPVPGEAEVEIGDGSWSVIFRDDNGTIGAASGRLGERTGSMQSLIHPNGIMWTGGSENSRCGRIFLSNNRLILNLTPSAAASGVALFPIASRRLTFDLDRLGDQFRPGTSVTRPVAAGQSHIFFTLSGAAFRTNDVIVISGNENRTFVFNNFTLVVEVANPANPRTLGSL